MKRSELVVGQMLYHARPRDYQNGGGGKKVEVLHVEPWRQKTQFYVPKGESPFTPTPDGKGNLVHVRIHDTFGGKPHTHEDVVRLGDLHGDYDTVAAEMKKQREATREALLEAQRRDTERCAHVETLRKRAKALGATSAGSLYYGVHVSIEDFERLLHLAERGADIMPPCGGVEAAVPLHETQSHQG